jgi:serine/threonine-protein kinase RsbW
MKIIKVTSELSQVDRIRDFFQESLKDVNLGEEAYYWLELSLVEMAINIVRYAYPEGGGEIWLKVWREGDWIHFEIRDNGIPFDPTKATKPDIKHMMDRDQQGGLGIYLTRKLMDRFDYKRENQENILVMSKRLKGSELNL